MYVNLAQRGASVAGFIFFGIHGFFIGFFVATFSGCIIVIFLLRKYLTSNIYSFSKIFKQSKNYIGLKLLKASFDQMDRPVIGLFLGAEALANYHVAKRLYENFCEAMLAVVVPIGVKFGEFKAEGKAALKNYFFKTLVIIGHVFIPAGFTLIVLSDSLLWLYGGEKYVTSGPVLAVFGFTLMGASLWSMVREAALRLVRPRHLAIQYIGTSVTTLIAYCLLIPSMGVAGIPMAIGLGYIVGLIPILYSLKKEWDLQVPLKQILISCACGFTIMITMIHLNLFDDHIAKFLTGSLIAMAVYLGWLRFIGPVEAATVLKELIGKSMKKRFVIG